MRQAVCAVLTLIMAGPAMSQATADSSAYPSRVHHRSGLELAGAAPGALVYLPAQLVGYGARQTARLLYEERTIYRLKQALTFADGRVGVRPLAGSLNGMGARMFIHQIAGRVDVDLTSTLGASGRTRQNHLLTISSGGPRVFSAYYRSEPKEAFYGVGNDLAEADKTNFRQRDIYLQVTSRRSLAERVFLDWDANWHRTEIEAGGSDSSPSTTDVYSPDTLPGLADKIDFFEVGLTFGGAFVDVPGSPTRGNRSRLRLSYRQSVDDDEFSHLQAGFVTEQFLELFYRRTVSLALGADWRAIPFGKQIPFYDLAALGGTEILRGYKRGRFRDRGITYAVGTYKFPVWQLIEGSLFYETGRTYHEIKDLTLADWSASFGGGLRVWVPRGVVFELNLAKSDELTRILFAFATTF